MIAVMSVTFAVALFPMVLSILIAMGFLRRRMIIQVTWYIYIVVPMVLHKEHRLAAGVVFVAVFAPMFGVAGRDAQIDRRAVHWYPIDHSGLAIDHLWLRIPADLESTIKAWLSDADGNTHISGEYRRGGQD